MDSTASRFAGLLALLASGCATPIDQRIARLHEGMTKQELVNSLGPPTTSTSQGAFTIFEYDFFQRQPAALHPSEPPKTSYYFIIGREGRVRSFGQN